MSDRLPRLTAKEIISILNQRGFTLSRSSGSHHIYVNEEKRRVTVSVHAHKIIHPKILKRILQDMDMTEEELKHLIGR